VALARNETYPPPVGWIRVAVGKNRARFCRGLPIR
jgi:hypothetical protein